MAGQSDGWITTARVLRRTGFGVTGAQVDAVAAQNWPKYVDAALGADPEADPGVRATPMPTLPAPRGPGKGASVAPAKSSIASCPARWPSCPNGGCAEW